MDRVTQTLLREFSDSNGILHLSQPVQFEHLTGALMTQPFCAETLTTTDIITGGGSDCGIDAIGIIVNGELVTDAAMVEDIATRSGSLDVTFVFVQAKTSSNFDGGDIGTFSFGVLDFFSESPRLAMNTAVQNALEITNEVFDHSAKFVQGNPRLFLAYVTTGRWENDASIQSRADSARDDLVNLELFREVTFDLLGAAEVQSRYRASQSAISRDFTMSDRIVLPEIPGVEEAYLGVVPASELLKILRDEHGEILKSIFYDNVRDWQDYNAVNSEIKQTLESEDERRRFVLMNNGVTVIAKQIRATGNRLHIEDYQVVNGCQTSHVLVDNAGTLDDSVSVPVRVIATTDESVIQSVIKATNRQTAVKPEQLIALSDFQKDLEAYFSTFDGDRSLFYERRLRQYASSSTIEKTRIVTPQNLIRAYASMIRGLPHRTARSYATLIDSLGTEIFGPRDRTEPYYLAAAALYRLEYLYRNGLMPSELRPARYQLLYAARILMNGHPPPPANSNAMARYATDMLNVVWDPVRSIELFENAAEIVRSVAGESELNRDLVRTQAFTEGVESEAAVRRRT